MRFGCVIGFLLLLCIPAGAEDSSATLMHRALMALGDSIGPRPEGSAAESTAAEWVSARLMESGWRVSQQRFTLPSGLTSRNVIADLPRPNTVPPVLLIGAHLDAFAGSPGGDDNASGCAVLLALARWIADRPTPLPSHVRLVFFGAEEAPGADPDQHHFGSRAYVDAARRTGSLPDFMLSVDKIGVGDRFKVHAYGKGPTWLRDRCLTFGGTLWKKAAIGENEPWSDHAPFASAGVDAAWITLNPNPRKHTPRDRPETVDPANLTRMLKLLESLVESPLR